MSNADHYNLQVEPLESRPACQFCTGIADFRLFNRVLTARPVTFTCESCLRILSLQITAALDKASFGR